LILRRELPKNEMIRKDYIRMGKQRLQSADVTALLEQKAPLASEKKEKGL